ncbi:MAG: diversity-generating retroelement protein Avd [Candidatus Thiodiazotropha taylori]
MAKDLVILARVYDLLTWLLPKGERFPRAYRHTVTRRMLDAALDAQEGLFEAQVRQGRSREDALEGVDAALNRLRLYLRLAHQWHWLNDGQYEHVSRMVAEIGRLLGSWLQQVKGGKGKGAPG